MESRTTSNDLVGLEIGTLEMDGKVMHTFPSVKRLILPPDYISISFQTPIMIIGNHRLEGKVKSFLLAHEMLRRDPTQVVKLPKPFAILEDNSEVSPIL